MESDSLTEALPAVEKRHWVRLTRVCNQRCLFCLDRGAQNGSFLSLASLKRDLTRGRNQGIKRVVLSGGEPTIHPEYIEVVRSARALGYTHVQTITNGRRFCYPAFFDSAVEAGLAEVTFSLHGNTPALHDRLTRVPGSFVQLVSSLRRALARPGLIVSVDVVINRLNLPVLREILDFCIGLGVREFDLLALVPFGDAWRHRADLFCDFSVPEHRAQLRRALEVSRRPDLVVWTNRLRPECLEGFESLIQPPEKLWDEVRGRRRIFARYLNGGKPPSCGGEACPQCFLRDFCKDLAVLVKDKSLPPRRGPLCLEMEPDAGLAAPGVTGAAVPPHQSTGGGLAAPGVTGAAVPPHQSTGGGPFRFGRKANIFEFVDFYIRRRYFAKGLACAACALAGRCDGVAVKALRETGFGALRPCSG